ncbi:MULTISPECIES: bactofilin family protein [Halolamina]|uniref:Polymer-forming protein n=1 Tax=Halolamina pelagica TaxID=699431 RepID=A0A1I5NV85_9EURY|nr:MULTISPECIES: polymer-forming cytoskeletal protein [Halolamina]NHX36488.1 polymer-forming cytoskeletal protein [Halolamina sp. R1-12]SFP25540.1 Polymer-forming protein [Halolamina pelagica]
MLPPDSGRSRRIVALTAVLVVLLPLASGIATAQSTGQVGGTIVIDAGETVDGIEGVAGTIVVRGTVDGDLSGTAGTILITESGTVTGDVQGAAGSVVVAGTVEGDVQVGAGSFDLTETGAIRGNLDVGAGSVTVAGTVGGNVRAGGDTVTLGPNADVGGEFRYDAEQFTRSDGATVAGGVIEDDSIRGDTVRFGGFSIPSWFDTAFGFVTSVVLGAVLLLVSPRFSAGVASRVGSSPAVTAAAGLLALIGIPVLLVLVAVTIIGLPFSLAGFAAYGIALWIASVYGKYAVGSWLLSLAGLEHRWFALLVGVIGFLLLGLIPVVGGIAELVAVVLGLGAVALGLRDGYEKRRQGSAEATPAD